MSLGFSCTLNVYLPMEVGFSLNTYRIRKPSPVRKRKRRITPHGAFPDSLDFASPPHLVFERYSQLSPYLHLALGHGPVIL